MCKISDKLILCTCEITDIQRLIHYWILYRYNAKKGILMIGETIGFDLLLQMKNPDNLKTLLDRLNGGNIFDKTIDFKNKDRLQISIHFNENDSPTDYGFEFKNGKWKVFEFDYFIWKSEHFEVKEGKIKNAVSRRKW